MTFNGQFTYYVHTTTVVVLLYCRVCVSRSQKKKKNTHTHTDGTSTVCGCSQRWFGRETRRAGWKLASKHVSEFSLLNYVVWNVRQWFYDFNVRNFTNSPSLSSFKMTVRLCEAAKVSHMWSQKSWTSDLCSLCVCVRRSFQIWPRVSLLTLDYLWSFLFFMAQNFPVSVLQLHNFNGPTGRSFYRVISFLRLSAGLPFLLICVVLWLWFCSNDFADVRFQCK